MKVFAWVDSILMNLYPPFHRLLLDAKNGSTPPSSGGRGHNGSGRGVDFDINMVIILAALLCSLICALGINSIVRCVLRCFSRMSLDVTDETLPVFGRKGLKKGAIRQIPVVVYGSGDRVCGCLAGFAFVVPNLPPVCDGGTCGIGWRGGG